MTAAVLILRPQAGAAATAARAAALGMAAQLAPLFEIAPIAWTPPDPRGFDAVMLTSANAIRHGGAALTRYRGLPAYAVGGATAAAAREAGFEVAATGDGDGATLLERIADDGIRRILHLAGRERRAIGHAALTIHVAAVYAAEPVARLPVLPAAGMVALLHSPRAAALYRRLIGDAGLALATLRIAAISPAALAAAGDGWARSGCAAVPTDDALLAAALRLCD